MYEKPLRIIGNYSIAPTFRSIAASGPERKPYLTMESELGKAINKKGRGVLVHLDYRGAKNPRALYEADPNTVASDTEYLVFLSFDHHRMRIMDTDKVEILNLFHSRALVIMNNIDSELIYGVPNKDLGPNFRCWIDETGTLCQEALEVTHEQN